MHLVVTDPRSVRRPYKPPLHPSRHSRSPHPRSHTALSRAYTPFRFLGRRPPTVRPNLNLPASTTATSPRHLPNPNPISPSSPVPSTSPSQDANEALFLRARVVPRLDPFSLRQLVLSHVVAWLNLTGCARPGLPTSLVFNQTPLGTYPSMAGSVQVCVE